MKEKLKEQRINIAILRIKIRCFLMKQLWRNSMCGIVGFVDQKSKKENNGRKIFNIYCFLIWYQVYFIE